VLAQTVPVEEILILDDCSTDNFKEVVQGFTDPRIKVLAFDENRGMQEAMNQMAFRANGDFFVALSADDTLAPTYVEKCLAKFTENQWLEFVASQTDFIDEKGEPYADLAPVLLDPEGAARPARSGCRRYLPGNVYFGAGMYRTKVLSEVGGWEKKYKVISDYQLYLKLIHRGENLGVVEEPLTHTRIHGKNDSLLDQKRAKELPWLYHYAKAPSSVST
jgi:glycosyltransferase involved in cell wall biosynthesis